ncbi:MAG: TetR/AcrR family transcriptional regulator [Anaerolineae bacterium]
MTREALERAFVALLQEKGYEAITIGDILQRANVSRSTFYRYFQGKPDLLVSLHQSLFKRLNLGLETREMWLAKSPTPALVSFFEQTQRYDRSQLLFFSKDAGLLLHRINTAMTQEIREGLRTTFDETTFSIPLELLAQSIAGTYIWVFQWWMRDHPPYTPAQVATYTHDVIRAQIQQALTPRQIP